MRNQKNHDGCEIEIEMEKFREIEIEIEIEITKSKLRNRNRNLYEIIMGDDCDECVRDCSANCSQQV